MRYIKDIFHPNQLILPSFTHAHFVASQFTFFSRSGSISFFTIHSFSLFEHRCSLVSDNKKIIHFNITLDFSSSK
jgi:hypothetical protein